MENVCRLCLRKEESMLYIFSFKKEELCSQILNCCSIVITENDTLPKLICMECIEKLQSFYEFKEKCKQSDSILRQHYKVEFNLEHNLSKIIIYQDIHVQTDETNATLQMEKSPLPVQANEVSKENDSSTYSNSNDDHIQIDDELDNSEHIDNIVSSTSGSQSSLKINYKLKLKNKSTRLETSGRRRSDRLKNKKIYNCDLCDTEFESRRGFIEHSKLHIDENYNKRKNFKLFKCEFCELRFNKKSQLHSHMRLFHGKVIPRENKGPYRCDICNKNLSSRSGFRRHLQIHKGNKQFACRFCDKTFIQLSYKNRHEKVHARKAEFGCNICTAKFTSYNGLRYHVRIHTGEVNYLCDICNKAFSKKRYLEEHIFTHTGEKPFVCKICGIAYGHSGSLYSHQRKCRSRSNLNYITPAQEENHK